MNKAIGIDPDSKGYLCCLVDAKEAQGKRMGYLTTVEGLDSLVRWVKKEGEPIVAIEGSNGLSKPVEDAFRKEQMVVHSLRPSDVSKFRKVVLGQNKNNEKDAESVARYALALHAQGKLEQFRRVWFPDESLRLLSRGYERKSKELTAELNRMWKVLRIASPDLYLALRGSNPEVEISDNGLRIQGILSLLEQKPDLFEWKDFSTEGFRAAMGGGNYRGRQKLIDQLRKISDSFSPTPAAVSLLIRSSAQTILQARRQLSEMKKLIREITAENTAPSDGMLCSTAAIRPSRTARSPIESIPEAGSMILPPLMTISYPTESPAHSIWIIDVATFYVQASLRRRIPLPEMVPRMSSRLTLRIPPPA